MIREIRWSSKEHDNQGLTFSNTPKVFSALDDTSVRCLHIFCAANNGEWHSVGKDARMFGSSFIISIDWWLIDTNTLDSDDLPNLETNNGSGYYGKLLREIGRTYALLEDV